MDRNNQMRSPTLPLHKAQVDRIEADTTYTLYDENPQDAAYPYVVMGEITARDWSDKFVPGMEVYSTLHIWSTYNGRKEAEEMADGTIQALTRAPLNLAGFNALGYFESWDLIIDIDGITRHGILKFRYLIEEV